METRRRCYRFGSKIDGFTIHHWAGIPVGEEEGTAGTKDTAKMSTRCQCLRFILIDEISMVSCELLTTLESIVTLVVRIRSGHKRRADGSTRAFGGINLLVFGDWWQIAPVGGTAMFANPLETNMQRKMRVKSSSYQAQRE